MINPTHYNQKFNEQPCKTRYTTASVRLCQTNDVTVALASC